MILSQKGTSAPVVPFMKEEEHGSQGFFSGRANSGFFQRKPKILFPGGQKWLTLIFPS